jgi:twitching motility two-component system response regulator PilH
MAKIMIVDDSPADLSFMNDILSRSAHTVTPVSNPVVVESLAASERPDLIFLDVVMPERNGYEVLRALKRQDETKDTKVVFVSSKGGESDVKWGMRQGATDYLIKPYTAVQVMAILEKHLRS